jgi:hypothetical protein
MRRISAISAFQRGPRPEPLTEAEREAVERGEADAAAGRVVPHDKVRRWLLSWGKPDELPRRIYQVTADSERVAILAVIDGRILR